MNSFTKKTRFSLWVTIFVYFLLSSSSTQIAHAQFGLFDTVWTINKQGTKLLFTSKNDSLLILYEEGSYLFHLINTLDKSIIWTDTWNPYGFINNDSCLIFHGYLTNGKEKFENLLIKNTYSLNTLDSIAYNENTLPFINCLTYFTGISEIDTSVYYSGYCNVLQIKASTYKVNFHTGVVTITSDSLPYFAMKISEDGQYISGIYYERRNITVKDSYYEILEVRRIKDYSLVYKNETYYTDYKSDFTPYQWVRNYELKFSKNNKYLLLRNEMQKIKIYDLISNSEIYNSTSLGGDYGINCFTNDSKGLFYKHTKFKWGYGMKIEKIEYCLHNLEKNQTTVYENIPEFPLLEFNKERLVLNDKYYLATQGFAVFDSNYVKYRYLGDISLIGLNFEINSIQEPEQKYIGVLYPNPAEDYIKIDLSNYTLKGVVEKDAIRIFDIYGKCALYVGAIHELPLRIDVSSLPAGVYFVRIGDKVEKFVKI